MKNVVKSTCCYCGVGCGVLIEHEQGRIIGVSGDPEHPANYGRLCTKGASLHLSLDPSARLLYPERRQVRGQPGERISWDLALDEAAGCFAETIRRHGPDSVAFYISGQLLTEDYYVFNKLAKGLIGTNNVDTNSRLCMSSAVAGYKQTLGVDAPPCAYEDIGQAGMIFIAGANPAIAHPIVFRRIEDAKAANPNLKIIVADPRRTESAAIADLHLALKPGTDIALFNGMMHVLLAEDLVDRDYIAAHTCGFAELTAIVEGYSPEIVAELCGVPAEDIVCAARWFARSGPTLSLYCQGLNQSVHGTHNNAALIHLHLATGQIGKPGAGPFSLTGQPNAMGGREVGGLANLLSAHRDLANPEHRAEIARMWGIPDVPAKPGKSAIELFKGLESGEIKAVWIACTNPAHSLPNQAAVRSALGKAEYVVLQEAYADTDTAACADLILPASTWGEKRGTVTNSERRISCLRPAVQPPGEARHDWEIAVDFARHLGHELKNPATNHLFPYADVEEIFNEHRESTRGRDLDITGLSYTLLETDGPQQWPFAEGAKAGQVRLYADGRFPTPDGKARFVPVEHQATADITNPTLPISLISGRMRDQWHGMSRTGTVPRLFNVEDEPLLAMHPCDMLHNGLNPGDLVRVANPRGATIVRVQTGVGLRPGRAWLPMHWGSRFMNSPGANAVSSEALDPYSLQPELKHAAVRIARADLPYPLVVLRRCSNTTEALEVLRQARATLTDYPYATASLYGGQFPVVVFRAATKEPLDEQRLADIDALFGLDGAQGAIDYLDLRRNIAKRAVTRDGHLCGVRLAGETLAQDWLRAALAENDLDGALIRFALAPSSKAPTSVAARHIVCKCADVSNTQIRAELGSGANLAQIQDKLKCGTFCGGCMPELKQMVADHTRQSSAAA